MSSADSKAGERIKLDGVGMHPSERKSHTELRQCRSYDPSACRHVHYAEPGPDGYTRHHSLLRSKSDNPPSAAPTRTRSEASIGSLFFNGTHNHSTNTDDDEEDASRYAKINRMISPRYLFKYTSRLDKISELKLDPNTGKSNNVHYVCKPTPRLVNARDSGTNEQSKTAPDIHLFVNSEDTNSHDKHGSQGKTCTEPCIDSVDHDPHSYVNGNIVTNSSQPSSNNVVNSTTIAFGVKQTDEINKNRPVEHRSNHARVDRSKFRLFRSWSADEWTTSKHKKEHGLLSNSVEEIDQEDDGILIQSLDSIAMQKASKSPVSGRRILPKIRKSKAKQTSSPKPWNQKSYCTWSNAKGQKVVVSSTSVLDLSEKERQFLIKIAMTKLQAIELGCNVTVPKGDGFSKRSKRIFSISRKRSNTTNLAGLLDNIKDNFKDKGKDKENKASACTSGYVFGIPLWRCISNDTVLKRRRLSFLKERTDVESGNTKKEGYRRPSCDSVCSLDKDDPSEKSVDNRTGSRDSLLEDGDRSPRVERSPSLVEALSLQVAVDTEKRRQSLAAMPPQIPHVIKCCFQHLKMNGLQTLGIFRVGGSKKRTKQLREEFDSGKDVRLTAEHSPHDVGALLKEFFRDLPEPLLTRDLYSPFVATRKITDLHQQTAAMQCLISLLPPPNRDTLWSLLSFLSVVVEHSSDSCDESGVETPGNKMDSHNLATLFGPNLLHKAKSGVDFQVETVERAEDRRDVIEVVKDMIDMREELFDVKADTYNEIVKLMMDMEPECADYILRNKICNESDVDFNEDDVSVDDVGSHNTQRNSLDTKNPTEVIRNTSLCSESKTSKRQSTIPRTRKHCILRPPNLTITTAGDEFLVSDTDSGIRGCLTPDSAIHSPVKADSETSWGYSVEKTRPSHRKSYELAANKEPCLLGTSPRSRGSSPVPARSRSPRTERIDSFPNCADSRRSSTGSTSSSLQRPLMAPVRNNSVSEWQQNRWEQWKYIAKDSREHETLV